MSEQRKRLSEKEIRVRRLDQGMSKNPGAEQAARDLWADHDGAREDVKRLAARLRATCGDHDDGCNRMFSNLPGDSCCETGGLLAEVDPQ